MSPLGPAHHVGIVTCKPFRQSYPGTDRSWLLTAASAAHQHGVMSLRWYTVVVDCLDVAAQAEWWRETLGWQTVHEADDEVVIVPAQVTEDSIRAMPWEHVPPGLVFVPVPEQKAVKNRLHIDLAPHTSDDRDAEISALVERGATLVNVGQTAKSTWTVLADPEGNEFCVLSSRDL